MWQNNSNGTLPNKTWTLKVWSKHLSKMQMEDLHLNLIVWVWKRQLFICLLLLSRGLHLDTQPQFSRILLSGIFLKQITCGLPFQARRVFFPNQLDVIFRRLTKNCSTKELFVSNHVVGRKLVKDVRIQNLSFITPWYYCLQLLMCLVSRHGTNNVSPKMKSNLLRIVEVTVGREDPSAGKPSSRWLRVATTPTLFYFPIDLHRWQCSVILLICSTHQVRTFLTSCASSLPDVSAEKRTAFAGCFRPLSSWDVLCQNLSAIAIWCWPLCLNYGQKKRQNDKNTSAEELTALQQSSAFARILRRWRTFTSLEGFFVSKSDSAG